MTLYEINQQIANAIELGFDPETGEILDSSALEQLQIARDEKIENIALFIKDLNAEAKAIADEMDNLKKRKITTANKADSLQQYLRNMLSGEKFKTSKCSISYRKTQAVNVLDQEALPREYIRVKITEEPDKMAMKEAMKAGEEIPGAELEERTSMIIK